ncbi:magnesium transporter [Serratia marcescens]|nr:magnesium transporter [Serratia marcescens]PYA78609.1 magnesium transporter [Serratia marcescens]RAU85836.1 hypothetical protein DMW46_19490 [Serratia marcescens]
MKIRRYVPQVLGWVELDADSDTQAMVWTEVTSFEASQAKELGPQLGIDLELLEHAARADASFVTTDSDALLQMATRTARLVGAQFRYSSLLIVLTPKGVTTVESGDSGIGATVRREWVDGDDAEIPGPWAVLAQLLDSFAESYLPLVESAEDQVLAMEEHLFEAPLPDEQISVLFRLRRQLILLQRVLGPVSKLVARLGHMNPRLAGAESPDFRGAQDGLHRIESRVEGLWQVVTSVVEMSNLMEQQRQGSASRKLAAWASIVAVPTALSGIFGMNFIQMPGTDVEYGYLGVLAVMVVACAALFVRFKKIGWL